MKFEALSRSGNIGKVAIKNRIVMPALNNNYTRGGFMTEESVDFYVSRARGGAGLIIVEATSVDYPRSRSVLNPALDDDKYLPAFAEIAGGCHHYGAKVFVQLSHVGRQTRKSTTGMDPVAPSEIASASPLYPDKPKVLSVPEIRELAGKFAAAALRAKKAGLDGVELICAHGYLINNFLTPASNLRTDEYGGIRGGIRFCADIVRGIRDECGTGFPIICRINGDDYIREKGNTPIEAQLIAEALWKAGADAINVSAGMRDSDLAFNDHTAGMPRGAWIHLAERIRRGVGIPVIAVKRLSPQIAEEAVRAGKIDFAAFGKQFIADSDFANKVLADDLDEVIPCTSCCQGCYDRLWMKLPITCTNNPAVGQKISSQRKRAATRGGKKVLVVGGGPAGCETAREAAGRGHSVTLVEKASRLGGNYGACRFTAAKREVGDVFAYLDRALRKKNVDIRLNTEFTVNLLDETGAEVVVDATGAKFKIPDLKGAGLVNVLDPVSCLGGSRPVGEYVVIVSCGFHCTWTCRKMERPIPEDIVGMKTSESYACGAGHAAADAAEELAARGKKVCVITERDSFVPGMGFTNRGNLFKRLFPANISVSNRVKAKQIVPGGLLCEKEGMEFTLCADTVVMSVGLSPENVVEPLLAGRGVQFFRVGDAARIGNALEAFASGYEVIDLF